MMVRSFDRRIESLFLIKDEELKKQAINILAFNLNDNVNAYQMQENGSYLKPPLRKGEGEFNIHKEFFEFYFHRARFQSIELFADPAVSPPLPENVVAATS